MTIERGEYFRQLCDEFISGDSPRYVFGTTPYAASIIEHTKVDGVIDDFTTKAIFAGVPVVKLSTIADNAIIVSAIVDGRPVTANRVLDASGIRFIDYFSFKRNVPFGLKEPTHVTSEAFNLNYTIYREKYDSIYAVLEDDESKETFSRLVNFRLNEDIQQMEYFSFRPDDIYFENFVEFVGDDTVFVDVGCFDGETTLEFIRHCPNYRSIHLFEPEPKQMAIIKSKLEHFRDIHFHEYGASNQESILRFASSGMWSHLAEDGDIEVKINKLDTLIKEKTTFIKMDIEGHEFAALQGVQQHIMEDHPALAICAYHLVDDFWKLPELVFSFRSDYKLYMRHYTEGVLETVYYFVPVKNA